MGDSNISGSAGVPAKTAVHRVNCTRGFTLIELVVVIIVLAGLAAIAVASYQTFVTRAQATRALSEASSMRVAAESEIFGVSVTPDELPEGLALDAPGDDTATITVQRPLGRIVLTRSSEGDWTCAHSFDTALPDCGVLEEYHTVTASDGLESYESGGDLFIAAVESYDGPDTIQIPSTFDGKVIDEIQQDAFNSTGIKEVIFAEDSQIKRIHARAFQGNEIREVTLPDSLERLDQRVFMNNPDLNRVTIGESVFIEELSGKDPFGESKFKEAYDAGGAGTYVLVDGEWQREQ